MMSCQDSSLSYILSIVKRIMLIIQIIIPILLILFGTISLIKLVKDPDLKNGHKKIVSQFIAAAVVFFIPMIVNLVISMIGERTNFSSCWIEADDKIVFSGNYYNLDKDRKSIYHNAKKYDKGKAHNGLAIAELAVRVAPIAHPDDTVVMGPFNFVSGEVSAQCGGMSPLPNPWYPPSQVDSRYKEFEKIMDAAINDENPGNKAYGSCAQAAGGIIRAVADPDFNTANPQGQMNYLKENPEKWEFIHEFKPGEAFSEICEPGDVLITTSGWEHTAIYVGRELAGEKFSGTKGNIFQAGYDACDHAKYPRIDYMESAPVPFRAYRFTGKGESKHKLVDVNKVLGG